jgi:hypothetical protein
MTAYAIDCRSLGSARAVLRANGIDFVDHTHQGLTVPALPALGGTIAFTEDAGLPPWL